MILLLFFLVGTFAVVLPSPPPGGCNGIGRSDLLLCVEQLLDANHDGAVNASEIDAFIATQRALGNATCLPRANSYFSTVNGAFILAQCDTNHDGQLTALADTSCLLTSGSRRYMCELCYSCGWSGPIVGKKKTTLIGGRRPKMVL